jgi:hypothetical protein
VRTATEADGMSYAYLTFPEGAEARSAGRATPQDPEPEPAPKPAKP